MFHSVSEETQSPTVHLCEEDEQSVEERCNCSQCESCEDSEGSECSLWTGSKTFAVKQYLGDLAKVTCVHVHLPVPRDLCGHPQAMLGLPSLSRVVQVSPHGLVDCGCIS